MAETEPRCSRGGFYFFFRPTATASLSLEREKEKREKVERGLLVDLSLSSYNTVIELVYMLSFSLPAIDCHDYCAKKKSANTNSVAYPISTVQTVKCNHIYKYFFLE